MSATEKALTPQQKLLGEQWGTTLADEFRKPYMQKLSGILKKERRKYTIFPKREDVFRAYKLCPHSQVRVIILGQDPYIKPKQAHGLAFSIPESLEHTPPSLENIFDEIERDLRDQAFQVYHSPDLTRWAEQGVFLLNTALTVRKNRPGSHFNIGWETFTLETIKFLNVSPPPLVFMLWGNHAKEYQKYIDDDHHLVLTSSHPSPLSAWRGFNGCGHFSKCNNFLTQNYNEHAAINWR